jgi:hypothetical protein
MPDRADVVRGVMETLEEMGRVLGRVGEALAPLAESLAECVGHLHRALDSLDEVELSLILEDFHREEDARRAAPGVGFVHDAGEGE